MTDTSVDYDLLIIGGGLVGASLACALAGSGLRIGMIEAVPFTSAASPAFDDRAIALAAGSQRIFSAMELWPSLRERVTPIRHIHVSDRGRFGFTRLHHDEEGVPALGYVALSRDLGEVLNRRLSGLADVELICPAELAGLTIAADHAQVRVRQGDAERRLTARLLVAADGARSLVREQVAIATRQWDYGQTALITNIATQLPHASVAYERFTDTGPLALLPMSGGRCSVVWTLGNPQVDDVMALDDKEFLARLQERFGQRLGRFERVGKRHVYPLVLVRALESVRPRLALIGNAAHTLHPIAGQGFNLGLRDVAALAEVLLEAHHQSRDIGELQILQRYADWRSADHRRVIAFTDGLNRLFSNPLMPVVCARDAGMLAMDLLPPFKRLFGQLTMGRAGRLPRLARGVPLE